jgi:hypothetical protein
MEELDPKLINIQTNLSFPRRCAGNTSIAVMAADNRSPDIRQRGRPNPSESIPEQLRGAW